MSKAATVWYMGVLLWDAIVITGEERERKAQPQQPFPSQYLN
jgi:hypothetical protein